MISRLKKNNKIYIYIYSKLRKLHSRRSSILPVLCSSSSSLVFPSLQEPPSLRIKMSFIFWSRDICRLDKDRLHSLLKSHHHCPLLKTLSTPPLHTHHSQQVVVDLNILMHAVADDATPIIKVPLPLCGIVGNWDL